MSQVSVSERAAAAGEVPVTRAPYFVRRKKGITPRSIAVLVFLTICALFFCVPLYVVVVTSFKTMDQIREGAIFTLPHIWTLEAWDHAWNHACSGIKCDGLKVGFWNSVSILFPSLILSISLAMVTGFALALWNVRWAGGLLFLLFICAFVPFQIIMYPLIVMTTTTKIYGTLWAGFLALVLGRDFIIEPTLSYLGSLVFLAVISTVLAFAAYLTLLGRIGAARAGYATVIFPVFALLQSTFLEGYQWTGFALAGLVLVAAGNVLVIRGARPK